MSTPAIVPTLQDAITAVENSFTTLANDQNVQSNAGAGVTSAQAKLDSANQSKSQADAAVATDVSTVNSVLDVLIQAATAAKIST